METKDTIKIFVKYLRDWYCDVYEISKDDFFENNNIDKLKFMKLAFFVAASRKEESALLKNENVHFHALPYGPVELDWYDYIKSRESQIKISNYSLKINFKATELDELDNSEIEKDFANLKKINKKLITYDSFKLVDLSHKWKSWKSAYQIAKLKGKNRQEISNSSIMNDFQYYL